MLRITNGWLLVGALAIVCANSIPAVAQNEDANQENAQSANKPIEVDPLLLKVEQALQLSQKRYLSAEIHTPWQISSP